MVLADFDSEDDLYKKSSMLVSQLLEWQPTTNTLPGMMEELWVYLYERGYIMIQDVYLLQKWIDALGTVGYMFPTKITPFVYHEDRQHKKNDTSILDMILNSASVISQVGRKSST